MLVTILRIIPPSNLKEIINTGNKPALEAIKRLETYSSLGGALSIQQQVYVDNNLDKLGEFLTTDNGKSKLRDLTNEFIGYVNSCIDRE